MRLKALILLFILSHFNAFTFYYSDVNSEKGIGLIQTPLKQGSINKVKKYTVTGKVLQTEQYCGGARPTDEILQDFATPKAYPGKKFYIRYGKINTTKAKIIKSFTSDSAGNFSFNLAPGTYSIIVEEQKKRIRAINYEKPNQKADSQCLQEWWVRPYYLLVVKDSNITGLEFSFHHRCFLETDIPCINYTGPLPP